MCAWYKEHRHLSKDTIEKEYFAFSNKKRSYGSLQTQLYKLGFGGLTKKKEGASLKRKASEEITTVVSNPSICCPPSESIDPAELSKAVMTISKPTLHWNTPDIEAEKEDQSPPRPTQKCSTPGNLEIAGGDSDADQPERTSPSLPEAPFSLSFQVVDQHSFRFGSGGQSLSDDMMSENHEMLPG